jgi:hypothetical protein
MALSEYTITDTMVGSVLPVPDGYLVSLTVTTSPAVYETPEGDAGSGEWKRGYLQLRGSRDYRDLYCNSPHSWGYLSKLLVGNQSLSYRGDLRVVCVPRGAVFSLTLSDVPNLRTSSPTPFSFYIALRDAVLRDAARLTL